MILIGLAIMGICGSYVLRAQFNYRRSNNLYDSLEAQYTKSSANSSDLVSSSGSDISSESESESQNDTGWYNLCLVDFEGLKELNKDVVGWIYFENEDLSYPILQGETDEQYLRTTIDGVSATAGSIFLEAMNSNDFCDSHSIIYGHNMKNLSMFGKLKFYRMKEGYYEDHMYFQIITPEYTYRYQIFAYEEVNEYSEIYAVPYGPNDDFQDFINGIIRSSYVDSRLPVTKDDKVITLSTCTGSDDYRFVVHGFRVDSHEW